MTRRRTCPACGIPGVLRVDGDGALRCVRGCRADQIVRAAVRAAANEIPTRPRPARRTHPRAAHSAPQPEEQLRQQSARLRADRLRRQETELRDEAEQLTDDHPSPTRN